MENPNQINQDKDPNFNNNKYANEEDIGHIGDMMKNLNIEKNPPQNNQNNYVKIKYFLTNNL